MGMWSDMGVSRGYAGCPEAVSLQGHSGNFGDVSLLKCVLYFIVLY